MYTIPYGRGTIEFELPADMVGVVLHSSDRPPLADPVQAIAEALAHPVNSPRLQEMARPGDRVCIVFTDATRASPDNLLVPPLLSALAEAGVNDDAITLLCGVGMHRPSTLEEKVAKLGRDVVARYRVIDSRPRDAEALVHLGTASTGAPVVVNRTACEADLLIATGIVEPHQYAGFSGGRKTVAIGAGGEELIAYTHSARMLDHPATRLGRIAGNPFHQTITEVARAAGLRFILNVVANDDGQIVAVRAGEPEAAFGALVAEARQLFVQPITQQYDIAIAGVGHPKDANLYQASRAATYLQFAPVPVVRPGGVIIIPARCQEGAGEGVGEQRCHDALCQAESLRALLDEMRGRPFLAGEQRAYMIAQVLSMCEVIIVGAECPDVVREMRMIPAASMAEALARAMERVGTGAKALIVPHALLTLPVLSEDL